MTRPGSLQRLVIAPLAAFCGQAPEVPRGGAVRPHLGAGTCAIGAHGGTWAADDGARIEGCPLDGRSVEIGDPAKAADSTPVLG